MHIRIGYTAWYRDKDLEKVIDSTRKAGFDLIEVSMDYPWPYKLSGDLLSSIRRKARDSDIVIGIHAPWRDISLASPLKEIREASVRVVAKCFDAAYKLEAAYVNVHLSTKQIDEEDIRRESLEAAALSASELLELAEKYALTLTFENVPSGLVCTRPEHFHEVFEKAQGSWMCFDVGHAASVKAKTEENDFDLEELLAEWRQWSDRMLVLHVHSYRVKSDGFVEDHIEPDEKYVRTVLKLLRPREARFIVIEAFRDRDGKNLFPEKLASLVSSVKAWLRAYV